MISTSLERHELYLAPLRKKLEKEDPKDHRNPGHSANQHVLRQQRQEKRTSYSLEQTDDSRPQKRW